MNLLQFLKTYKNFYRFDEITILCENTNCKSPIIVIQKNSARINIKRNGQFLCEPCIQNELHFGNKPSTETRQRMSKSANDKWETEWGKEQKLVLSRNAARQMARQRPEKFRIKGLYLSTKMDKPLPYASSYELRLCWLLDQDTSVKVWQTQVTYCVEGRGRCLDFLIEYFDERILAIEVKPKKFLSYENVKSQIADSNDNASQNGWEFDVYTEDYFEMTPTELKKWALAFRKQFDGIDLEEYYMGRNREKAKKHYDAKIATDTIDFWCDFCQDMHLSHLRKTYDANVEKNGRFICIKENGQIVGKLPKKKKVNPYALEGKKQCMWECKQVLSLEEFGNDKYQEDGHARVCKKCRAKKNLERYHDLKNC